MSQWKKAHNVPLFVTSHENNNKININHLPRDFDCIITITNNHTCMVSHLIKSTITGRFFGVIFACM